MALDKATVARIATLARIRVGEDELEPLAAELSGILEWVESADDKKKVVRQHGKNQIRPDARQKDVTFRMAKDL